MLSVKTSHTSLIALVLWCSDYKLIVLYCYDELKGKVTKTLDNLFVKNFVQKQKFLKFFKNKYTRQAQKLLPPPSQFPSSFLFLLQFIFFSPFLLFVLTAAINNKCTCICLAINLSRLHYHQFKVKKECCMLFPILTS